MGTWVKFLRNEKLLGHNDPLFPASRVGVSKNQQFDAQGLARIGWSEQEPIRKIFKNAFHLAGLPNFHPHSFRKTLTVLGEQICRTPEEFKSWSQNLGHDGVLTTFYSYGEVSSRRQASIMRDLARNAEMRTRAD